ncbi:MAG TPA: hypothetical protein VMR43_12385, partial [Variovorax sp.]|nr:hypothetical protein [Variovorax sp.]
GERSAQAPQKTSTGGMDLHTDWSTPWDDSPPDAERHELFASYALEVAMEQRPLLVRFLIEVGAKVIARPHTFCYQLAHPDCWSWVHVPEIASRLVLLPWVEAHETVH